LPSGNIRESLAHRRHCRISGNPALFEHADDPSALTHAVLELANHRTMFGDDELKWPVAGRFRVGAALLRGLASGLVQEVGHPVARMAGQFDTARVTRTY
jgi:hypothetical protein